MIRIRLLWRAFLRSLLVFLGITTAGLLILAFVPGALQEVYLSLSGNAAIPAIGPMPEPPVFDVLPGELPHGVVSFSGIMGTESFACGFLLELDGGQQVGLSAAHATPPLPANGQAWFQSPGGALRVGLGQQVARGQPFYREHFTMDFVVWSVAEGADPALFLQPDARGQAQVGERVRVFGRFVNELGESQSWPGVVIVVDPQATWIQLAESFDPVGFSGCPVVSEYTGQVVGMAVAGLDRNPVVMGLHPIGSLVEKAHEALISGP